MDSSVVWLILQEIDSIWLGISLISIFFFFFYVKVKFQKAASLKAYGILFYAFVFYTISSISFVILNALDQFFRISSDLYADFLWFFPITIMGSLFGAFIGWIIYFTGSRIAEEYVYKLMNLSLLVIAPTVLYTVLWKPINQTFKMAFPEQVKVSSVKDINTHQFLTLENKANYDFEPAIPSQLFDSLLISVQQGNRLNFVNGRNGFSFSHQIPLTQVEQLYVYQIPEFKQMALLALSPAIQGKSQLLVLDSLGTIIYSQSFQNQVNRLSGNHIQSLLMLEKEISTDSLEFNSCVQIKP